MPRQSLSRSNPDPIEEALSDSLHLVDDRIMLLWNSVVSLLSIVSLRENDAGFR
jgi:hypothetical protein